MVNFDIYTSSLFTISMFFLYIFNNYFNKYSRFHKDTNVVVQMLQAFQVSELQYPAYTSDYKHGCHGPISKTVYTRQISKSSDFWLYVRSDTYIERLVLPTLFTKYTLLSPGDVTNPIFARSTRLKYKSLERINMSYKIVDLT